MSRLPLIQSFKRNFCFSVTVFCVIILTSSFSSVKELGELALETQVKLNYFYDTSRDGTQTKKLDLKLTEDGFLRCRKTFSNGKVEYHSFNVTRLTAIDYLGSEQSGDVVFKTFKDDIIVQTYNDRKGDVDSMSSSFNIPVKAISAEDLLLMQNNLLEMKQKLNPN